MQFGGRDAGGFGNGVDLGLVAPMPGDMGDGAAHDVIVVGGGLSAPGSVTRSGESMAASYHLISR